MSAGRRSSLGSVQDLNKRNKKGETLLHVACNKGKVEEVTKLLAAGALSATKDYAGWTPLHEVAQQGRLDLAHLLLEHGAKVNVPGGNLNTPLHEAVVAANPEMVGLLIKFGALPDQRNLYGCTPREMAKDAVLAAILNAASSKETASSKSCSDDTDSLLSYDQRQILVMEDGLDRSQRAMLASLSKVLPIQRTTSPSKYVRLVITPTKNNICERSVAVLTGLSVGAWIVSPEWLEASAKIEFLVDPEPYEVYGTVNHIRGEVPKIARNNFKNQMPGLFAGCHFYFGPAVNLEMGLDRNQLSLIVRLAGGQMLTRTPDPEEIPAFERTVPFHARPDSVLSKCSHYIIYQSGQREPQIKYNMQHIKSLPHTWLLLCIENFSLLDP